ncbi:MAG: aldo/keto reductase [Phycisphaerae bacterium]|nr:aldo/keto reductase [Phycisphaerae bacterium]
MTSTRNIPGTDVEVSPICLGTMTFGNPVYRDDAIRIVHWALDHGINFIDTADMYEGYDRFLGSPGGVAEHILGEALRGRRQRAIVTTKVGNPVGDDRYEGSGLGRQHIRHQIDASLLRLQTDYVDFYELHKADPDAPLAESIEVMAELVATGKVRHWGFSNFEPPRIREMLDICARNAWPRPVIAQPPYSWLQRAVEEDYIPTCRENDIAVTPYQPLQGGLLTGKYRRDRPLPSDSRAAENPAWLRLEDTVYDRLEQFEQEAEHAGLTPSRYAIHWLLARPGVVSVVVGCKRIDQLDDLMRACRTPDDP